ncbi:hypothetical protein ANN_10207 [Periplaneta americana]|uniref:Uncharacterized protein n=1 Tax=Periplaneta americana TaxID=6978 RepID=A0ABQ8TNE0_PERAM|nr:hypothetical protein ANN_10207 [Periplaneta americana]
MYPEIPLPPKPILTRWGTWLEAVEYYAEHIDSINNVLLALDSEDAVSIDTAKTVTCDISVKNDLAHIQHTFSCIIKTLKSLQNRHLSLSESFEIINSTVEQLNRGRGKVADAVRAKVDTVLSKNPGYEELQKVVAVMSGESTVKINLDLSPADIVKLNYVPVTSCDVERSFSQYKSILRDNRRRFTFQHLKEMFVTYCYEIRHSPKSTMDSLLFLVANRLERFGHEICKKTPQASRLYIVDCGDIMQYKYSRLPIIRGCEQLQNEAFRRARALGTEGSKVRIPTCNNQGDFDPVQCDVASSNCWCVDEAGFEVPGTRASARGLVNCTNPKPCAAHTCRMLCPHGFALDADGCPKCQCYDPCNEVKCPGALSCELEDVACVKQPCPPIPRCKRARSLENVCPVGEPLKITDSDRPFLCGTSPGKPRCPPLFECLVERDNDYGVCCPASFKLQKPGSCPKRTSNDECGMRCEHDLECPSMQKCCDCGDNGKHCMQPLNVTVCLQQRMLAELLVMNEREGRGYVPQCSPVTGQFETRQCSRNGLICWCVDARGNKLPKSMGPRDTVNCRTSAPQGRSLSPTCDKNICAQVCEYGFKMDPNGCPTCECDDPCAGFPCGPTEECIAIREEDCTGFLCPTYPQCQPRLARLNLCKEGEALKNALSGEVVLCGTDEALCPNTHTCTYIMSPEQAVCCPREENTEPVKVEVCPEAGYINCENSTPCQSDEDCGSNSKCCFSNQCGSMCMDITKEDRPPSMCEYLRDFADKMEGTREGMTLALSPPKCHQNGSFEATQCSVANGERQCWCVDSFGTEIPGTRTNGPTSCVALREELGCLDLTCRLGCDYGFVLDPSTRCPLCECRNPCDDVSCPAGEICQIVEVNCEDEYCPPVPACLPKKPGQCPYLIPVTAGSCEYECRSDLNCNGTTKCCSNGCGTQCVEPVMLTVLSQCERLRERNQKAAEKFKKTTFMPRCDAETGDWEPVQCLEQVGVCWCVNRAGEPLKGSLTRDIPPTCNFRQARRRMHEEPDFDIEQLLEEVSALKDNTPMKTRCQTLRERMTGTNAVYAVNCDAEGRFSPTQCYPRKSEKFPECWCVDEAGNQLPNTTTFKRGAKICLPTPIQAIEVQLGFQGRQDKTSNQKLMTEVRKTLEKLGATLHNNVMEVKTYPDVTYVTFEVVGSNKVDVAFHLEEMVRARKLTLDADALVADITSSRFSHRLSDDASNEIDMSDRVIALEHREIVSQSTVSMVTPYQTAIVVLSVASAFVICILVLVIALYRKKMSACTADSMKANGLAQRFLSQPSPIYVVSLPPNSKTDASLSSPESKKEEADKVQNS